MRKRLLCTIIFALLTGKTFGVSINAEFAGQIIEENRFFIDFINPHVTNFRSDEYFTLYKDAVNLDFDANTYYLSGEYVHTYHKIIESQKKLRKLYYDILTNRYEMDAARMLKMSGPIILLAKDKQAEYDLKIGYTFLAKGIDTRKLGYSTNAYMLSKKIKYYIEAINNQIKAKKYAVLALIESTIPLIDKKEYKKESIDVTKKRIETIEIKDYEFIKNELINNINKKALPTDFPFLLHHNDNYRQIDGNKKSLLNEIGDSMNARMKSFKNDKSQPVNTNDLPGKSSANDKTPDKAKKEGEAGTVPQK